MVTRRVRKAITEIVINDSLVPPPNVQEIFEAIELMGSFSYNKKLLLHFLPKLKEPNPKFDRKIWKNIKRDEDQDPFLALLVGVTYMIKKKYSKACKKFEKFLNRKKKFVLNSFVIIKLLKCYKRLREFNKILNHITPGMRSLRKEHKFIVFGFRALCFEILNNKTEAENCYMEIERLGCRASLACEIWLDIQKDPIKKGLSKKIDNLMGFYNGQALKDLQLLKAFLLYRKGKLDVCIGILTSILGSNRNVKISLCLLGKIFYEQNQLSNSANYYLIALDVGKSCPEYWYNLYKVYEKCEIPLACGLKERAEKLDTGDPKILNKIENDLFNVHINFAKFFQTDKSKFQMEDLEVKPQRVQEQDSKLLFQLQEKQ